MGEKAASASGNDGPAGQGGSNCGYWALLESFLEEAARSDMQAGVGFEEARRDGCSGVLECTALGSGLTESLRLRTCTVEQEQRGVRAGGWYAD